MKINNQSFNLLLLLLVALCCFQTNNIIAAETDEDAMQDQTTAELFELEAIKFADQGESELSVVAITKYIQETGDFKIIEDDAFTAIYNTEPFKKLKDTYLPKFVWSNFLYLYVGLIGFFIAFILNIRKRTDRLANGLISLFVLMHSFFLIHVSLFLNNYTYLAPHTLSMSASFSFLYGPVLYFYFKRITENYKFKIGDLLHLTPTFLLIIAYLPVYMLSASEKLFVMLGVGVYEEHPYLVPVTIIKLLSLIIYGYLTYKVYKRNYKSKEKASEKKIKLQRTIMIIHAVYALSYAFYAIVIMNDMFYGVIFNSQLLSMTALVLYVGYIAYSNPKILSSETAQKVKNVIEKYKNSGLTPSFSLELKDELLSLLENEKIYRQNTIKLEYVAEKLGTTRHNASQVINEHFELNFFELINKYRVQEAMDLLKDNQGDLNIIDIAYEVGYNNKVTFNKSFKRFANLTPSQFVKLANTGI